MRPMPDTSLRFPAAAPDDLPALDPDALAHGKRVAAHLHACIARAGGWLPFEQWMDEALYAPGLGYYAAGSAKLAEGGAWQAGDFVTAPELTPLFGQALATQVAHVLQQTGSNQVMEFGAGTGALAESLIDALDGMGLAVRYAIVEVSGDLRARQRERLARHADRITWLDALPDGFAGCVIANEVLDAIPVRLFRWDEQGRPCERGVVSLTAESGVGPGFAWQDRPAPPELAAALQARMPPLPGYVSEINLRAEAWVREMGAWLRRGAALLIDYGFPRAEYYHPQRATGTLMCHVRHHAHAEPLVLPGLQDITAHVDFTAMADAALEGGLDVLGYTSQARFLIEAGLPALLAQRMQGADAAEQARAAAPVHKLLSEAEMGELFKVLAVGRGLDGPLPAFRRGDRRHML